MGNDLGIGRKLDNPSTMRARTLPAMKNPGAETPGQFQRMASRKRWRVRLRTRTKMITTMTGYAAACAPTTMWGSVARSATGMRWYRGMVRAMASAMMLKRKTAKTVNPNTASVSHHDHAGNLAGGGGVGSNDVMSGAGDRTWSAYSIGDG